MAKRGSIYIQSPNIRLEFDDALTVVNETHSFANEVVNQTLENGSQIADHIIVLQDELESQIFVSNSSAQKSQDVYSAIKILRNNRELCTVRTDHEIYSNMAIESVSAPHEAPQVNALTFTVKFKRVDWTNNVKNTYPLDKYQEPLVPQLQCLSTDFSNNIYKKEMQNRISVGAQNARHGILINVDDIEISAVSIEDFGQIVSLDNQQFPATSALFNIMTKISERNDYTNEQIETFFSAYSGNIRVAGAGTSLEELPKTVIYDVYQYDALLPEKWKVIKTVQEEYRDKPLSLETIFYYLKNDASFLQLLSLTPIIFNIISSGQVIQFELFYNELLHTWKACIEDAMGNSILNNITMMAGTNLIQDLQLKYKRINQVGNIVEEDLVLAGLYVTEPVETKGIKVERGIESSQYAFVGMTDGTSPCYVCYFEDETVSNIYRNYINGEVADEQYAYDELGDYVIA